MNIKTIIATGMLAVSATAFAQRDEVSRRTTELDDGMGQDFPAERQGETQ